uniref:Poly [ADP-ribose] polymerase n=1 Tax=Romanomermis culicivorax TaxID=13658 RepID=A0A915KKE3_ROMCU
MFSFTYFRVFCSQSNRFTCSRDSNVSNGKRLSNASIESSHSIELNNSSSSRIVEISEERPSRPTSATKKSYRCPSQRQASFISHAPESCFEDNAVSRIIINHQNIRETEKPPALPPRCVGQDWNERSHSFDNSSNFDLQRQISANSSILLRKDKNAICEKQNNMPTATISKKCDAVVWEYEKVRGSWIRLPTDTSTLLTSRCKQKETTIKIDCKEMKVNFQDMTVKSLETGFLRFLRCVVASRNEDEDEYFAWCVSENNKLWRSIPAKIIVELESKYQEYIVDGKKSSKTSIGDFRFDYDRMTAENETTSIKYSLRRGKSDGIRVSVKPEKIEDNCCAGTVKLENENPDEKTTKSLKRQLEEEERGNLNAHPPKSQKVVKSCGKAIKSTLKTIVLKGKVPVDPECSAKTDSAHVFCDPTGVTYDCMLNQTNIAQNNNKFYLIQLLEDDNSKNYSVWLRWGRVGFTGQKNLINCGSNLEMAKKIFCYKFYDKTRNHWQEKDTFEKVAGKYDLIDVNFSVEDNIPIKQGDEDLACENIEAEIPSKLDVRVQNLIKLICDLKNMEQTVKEMQYDADKSPLGKLTTSQIKAGYEALSKIERILNKTGQVASSALAQACSDFYTRIPHCFGMKVPPLIRDKVMLKREMELLDTLADIEVAIRVLSHESSNFDVNPLDRHYEAMNCLLTPLDGESDEFLIVQKYLHNTHGATHNLYETKLLDVFACSRNSEKEDFMKNIGNRMLLWHGSRLSNWYGIISQGLRIAPPEAPTTGYMFGKGVYFADCSSKSANYCFASAFKNVGLAVLCEVALGKSHELVAANNKADKLPPGFHSVKGLGKSIPDPEENIIIINNLQLKITIIEEGSTATIGVIEHWYIHIQTTLQYTDSPFLTPEDILHAKQTFKKGAEASQNLDLRPDEFRNVTYWPNDQVMGKTYREMVREEELGGQESPSGKDGGGKATAQRKETYDDYRWPNGTIPYKFIDDFSQQFKMLFAMQSIS